MTLRSDQQGDSTCYGSSLTIGTTPLTNIALYTRESKIIGRSDNQAGFRYFFQYTSPFDWYLRYRHAIDDHNNLRHALPSIEDSWIKRRWDTRLFSSILTITEVNAFLCLRYFTFGKGTLAGCPTLHEFRRRLAWQMIKNGWIMTEAEREDEVCIASVHQLMTAPPHAKCFRNQQWITSAKSKHQQYMCRNHCGRSIRTYCTCLPGHWLCYNCFGLHTRLVETEVY